MPTFPCYASVQFARFIDRPYLNMRTNKTGEIRFLFLMVIIASNIARGRARTHDDDDKGFPQFARDFPKSCPQFLKQLLKKCQKLLYVKKVAQNPLL